MELKQIHQAAVPRALSLCERYRLLNEPDQAESICRDVLAIDGDQQDAIRMLLLSLTDQFGHKRAGLFPEAEELSGQLTNPYERAYYRGIVYERWARCKLDEGVPAYIAGEWVQKAMTQFEEAEKVKPADDDSALLRWNTCARLMARVPKIMAESAVHEMHFGD